MLKCINIIIYYLLYYILYNVYNLEFFYFLFIIIIIIVFKFSIWNIKNGFYGIVFRVKCFEYNNLVFFFVLVIV